MAHGEWVTGEAARGYAPAHGVHGLRDEPVQLLSCHLPAVQRAVFQRLPARQLHGCVEAVPLQRAHATGAQRHGELEAAAEELARARLPLHLTNEPLRVSEAEVGNYTTLA
jgi:hypothetical protein